MVENDVGGGFGARGEFYPEDFLIPFAARHVKPAGEMDRGPPREPDGDESRARGGGDPRDRLRARRHHPRACAATCTPTWAPTCAPTARSARATSRSSWPVRIACRTCKIDLSLWMTNKTPVGTYRGPGRFETDFFRERLIDMVAADLGIDRVEFRRKNLDRRAGDALSDRASCSRSMPRTSTTAATITSTLDRCLKEIGWPKKAKLQGKLVDGRYHGLGVGLLHRGRRGRAEGERAARGQRRRHHLGLHGFVVGRAGRRDHLCADRGRRAGDAGRAHPRCPPRLDGLRQRRLRRLPLALDRDGRLGGARRRRRSSWPRCAKPPASASAAPSPTSRSTIDKVGGGGRSMRAEGIRRARPPRAPSSTRSTPTATARTSRTSRSMRRPARSRSSITWWCRTSAA